MSEYDEKIKTLDRKLEFSPVVNQHPKRLTKEQISFYNEQGYLSPFAIFEPNAVERNRKDFDSILQKFLDAGKSSYAAAAATVRVEPQQHRSYQETKKATASTTASSSCGTDRHSGGGAYSG